jgi:hypothetical protein
LRYLLNEPSTLLLASGRAPSRARCGALAAITGGVTLASGMGEVTRLLPVQHWQRALIDSTFEGHSAHEVALMLLNSRRVSLVAVIASSTQRGHGRAAVDSSAALILDSQLRTLRGYEMEPLVQGELVLLQFLGASALRWHSSYEIARQVYAREDAAARQLIWKYSSTARRKIRAAGLDVLQACRRRGYRCLCPILVEA